MAARVISLPARLLDAKYVLVGFVTFKIPRISHLLQTSNTMHCVVLVQMQSMLLWLERNPQTMAEASSHILHEKASNQSSMPHRSTQTLKCSKFLWYILICQIGALTNELQSVHLVKWLTENNWPINISNERELHQLLMAGHPSIQLPSNLTISCDIHVSLRKCQE